MRVTELNNDEMLQLKEALFYGADILPEMTDKQKVEIENALCTDDIPDELVHNLYADIYFVEEDFWCNV